MRRQPQRMHAVGLQGNACAHNGPLVYTQGLLVSWYHIAMVIAEGLLEPARHDSKDERLHICLAHGDGDADHVAARKRCVGLGRRFRAPTAIEAKAPSMLHWRNLIGLNMYQSTAQRSCRRLSTSSHV